MDYVVYCNESRHTQEGHTPCIAIGSLWVSRTHKLALTREFRALCQSVGLNAQIKWNKVSHKRLEAYKRIVDFFFAQNTLQFIVIVVNLGDLSNYLDTEPNLGVYKFYNLMLIQGISEGNQYLILVDFKNHKGSAHWNNLRPLLESSIGSDARILELTVIDAMKSPLAQLCDVLTGAVAASWYGLKADSPKAVLAAYIAEKLGLPSLQVETLKLAPGKFNIFTNSVALGV
ncbi:hypothetical protein [Aerosakkonema funiforme]|uniref:hypothetical protein n=1 Tax=Aerosakkonema funiforme TaxID=1246630 RepID=UPI0035B6F7DC